MTAAAAVRAASRAGAERVAGRARTRAQVERARRTLQRVGDLSDNIVGFGPFGIGLDGVLAWIPVVGTIYSVGAGAVLLRAGWRAHASPARLAAAAAMMLARTAVGEVPILGDVVVDLVRGHRYAARLLQAEVERTLFIEASAPVAALDPALSAQVAAARRTGRRVVFLGAE